MTKHTRRAIVCAVVAAAVVPKIIFGATLDFQLQRQSTQPAGTEWVQHGRDAQRTGY